jgi:Zn ribbon nucleic-acid-binding protein
METKLTCPHCKAKKQCFVEKTEAFESYMCFRCGYMSDSRFIKDSLEVIDLENKSPKLIKELKFFDEEREICWYPSILNMGTQGMIYPEPSEDDTEIAWTEYVWKYAKVVDVPEGKEADYNGHKQYLDVENARTFKKEEFLDACVAMGIVQLDAFNG